jgi:hypothetical protein
MKIRRTEFAMVPTWVILHEEMRGHGTRIATYVALRVIAFEFPDYEWTSEREIAESAARVAGCGSEACRKHMRAMRAAGIVTGDHGEIVLPHDPPDQVGDAGGDTGPHVGTQVPNRGDTRPQTPLIEDALENPPPTEESLGTAGADPKADARAAATGFFDRVKHDTGKSPVGIKFMALAKLIEPFLRAGYTMPEVKRAVWTVYTERRPWSLAVIEQHLDGRIAPGARIGKQLDALQAAINAENCRLDSA